MKAVKIELAAIRAILSSLDKMATDAIESGVPDVKERLECVFYEALHALKNTQNTFGFMDETLVRTIHEC